MEPDQRASERADELRRAVDRLVARINHWQPNRWSRPTADDTMSRAECVHGLAQRLADAAAEAEGRSPRPVPRLTNDLALVDQLRVLAADVLAAGDVRSEVLADLLARVRATAAALD
ncbi:MAG TPA: hypothetical protein VH442_19340 [Micromonosporaceae bacterium]|jgi:hypothetical protein